MARWEYAFRRGSWQTSSYDVYVNAVRTLLEEHLLNLREVGIAPGKIFHILKLNMRKICAQWVPHNLKEENMWQRMETARLHLEGFGRDGAFS